MGTFTDNLKPGVDTDFIGSASSGTVQISARAGKNDSPQVNILPNTLLASRNSVVVSGNHDNHMRVPSNVSVGMIPPVTTTGTAIQVCNMVVEVECESDFIYSADTIFGQGVTGFKGTTKQTSTVWPTLRRGHLRVKKTPFDGTSTMWDGTPYTLKPRT